ncbi:MAG TPA: DNA polymerase Y family protein [Rhodoblastus sp.]|nr:DNA polymerase Y family protein [Rhodoblastus sp.]
MAPSPPLATWAKVGSAQQLAAVDSAALRLGLRPGMALASARAMRPDLDLHQAEPQAEAELLASIADWLRRFTPLAAMDAPDGAMLDIEGCAHLFDGERAMIATIERGLFAQGFQSRCAIAPNSALAWALARFSATRILTNDDHAGGAKILRALPIAALRVSGDVVAGLRAAGLTRVGELLARPRAPLAARFGAELVGRLDAIVGAARDPISPRFEAAPYMAERRFAEGLARREDIERTLADLARDLCALLERHGEGARRIAASFFRVDGATRHIAATTSRPQRDAVALMRLMREKIEALGEDGLDTGYGFDVIRLAATTVETMTRAPPVDLVAAHADENDAQAFSDLVDRLGARFGTQRVQRLAFQDTHIPEFTAVATPASLARANPIRFPRPHGESHEGEEERLPPMRPARLFDKPEPIDATAAVPDGPPLRFEWRRTTHEVAAFEGPERIAPEWWRGTGLTRDYFRVEDRRGGRFWLYREGLFGHETPQPRWFVHGVFG